MLWRHLGESLCEVGLYLWIHHLLYSENDDYYTLETFPTKQEKKVLLPIKETGMESCGDAAVLSWRSLSPIPRGCI